jgi:chemotaxis signal transduction protein
MKKKKIRYSDFTVPQPPPLTRFTPVSTPAVAPNVTPAPAPEAPVPVPAGPAADAQAKARRARRDSAPVEIARALAAARAEAMDVAEKLAEVEARATAAHARELAESEAAASVATAGETAPVSARPTAVAPLDDFDDDDDEFDDRWDDDEYAESRGPRRPLRERARSRSGVAELLMFRIGRERFAVELLCVEEAIDLPEVHHVPEMPPAMLGVITVRGSLTPVFTPQEALGVPVEGMGAALIFRSNRGRFALAIDDVDDVMTLDLAQLRDAPGIDSSDAVVLGVTRNGDGIVALVDADALVAVCQATPVPELV